MMNKVKNSLKKYKNKILTFVCVIACIPVFSISSYAYTSSTQFPFQSVDALDIHSGFGVHSYYNPSFDANLNLFHHSNIAVADVTAIDITNSSPLHVTDISSLYDYYLVYSVYSDDTQYPFTFSPTSVCFWSRSGPNQGVTVDIVDGDLNFYRINGRYSNGFTLSCKLDMSTYSDAFILRINGFGVVGSNIWSEGMIISVPKDTSLEAVNAIVSAINNQTMHLGGKIDDTNNFIDKGNSSTGGIVSNFQDKDNELNEVVSQYREVENQFFEDFNTNQSAITSDIVGWSWGGLVNCADWVGTTLTNYYNNMGDFRQYIIYPLMLGIALFFLGRGGSIIGHLFRKPTQTTVNTKSVFRREGNTRYTTTTTSREGGVFRK